MRVLVVLCAFFAFSCGEVSVNDSEKTFAFSTYSGSAGNLPTDANGFLTKLPTFIYPEETSGYMEREIIIRSETHGHHVFHEGLSVDPDKRFRLDILGKKALTDVVFTEPSQNLLLKYEQQQRYLVLYRDLHLGAKYSLLQNFQWREDPILRSMAGRSVVRYEARSRYNLGDAEFFVDVDLGVLLGYTVYSPAGEINRQLTTTKWDSAAQFGDISWPQSLLSEEFYDPANNTIHLDFNLSEPSYLPPGFYQEEVRVLELEGFIVGAENMHIARFTDGIHQIFVAQHGFEESPGQPSNVATPLAATYARYSSVGGIHTIEGNPFGKRVYVVGQLAKDELHTVFSSLF